MPVAERLECGVERDFRFAVALSDLERARAVVGAPGEVCASGRTWVDARGLIRLSARVQGSGQLCCQRCLEPFDWSFEHMVEAVLVDADAQAGQADDLEPIVVDRGQLNVPDWLDDEMLLAIPLVPMHPDELPCEGRSEAGSTASGQRVRPFAGLGGLVGSK